jgi:hypothetical protein
LREKNNSEFDSGLGLHTSQELQHKTSDTTSSFTMSATNDEIDSGQLTHMIEKALSFKISPNDKDDDDISVNKTLMNSCETGVSDRSSCVKQRDKVALLSSIYPFELKTKVMFETVKEDNSRLYVCGVGADDLPGLRAWNLVSTYIYIS